MSLQRYDMIVSQSGNHMAKRPDGGWVDADEAQDEINSIRANIAAFSAWLDLEHEEGTCPEFRAAIRKVREAFSELV
jgi:hypothetical protein